MSGQSSALGGCGLVVPHASHRLWVPARLRNGRGSDAPGVRTPARHVPGTSPSGRWFRGISSVVLCHRILAGTWAQGRVDHLHHHAPVTLSKSLHNPGPQPVNCTTQHRAPEYLGVRATLIRWKPSKSTSRSHRSQRSSDTEHQVG